MLLSGQTLWKLGMNKIGTLEYNFNFIIRTLLDPYIFTGLVLYAVATILWLGVLSESELSKAFPIMSLSYVLVMIPAFFIFHEPITLLKIGGSILIMSGVALFLVK
jgi:drug/metabolite transporter (DMT)-like permease